jgi:hypothetical protein
MANARMEIRQVKLCRDSLMQRLSITMLKRSKLTGNLESLLVSTPQEGLISGVAINGYCARPASSLHLQSFENSARCDTKETGRHLYRGGKVM